jgi:hypothetical protein
VVYGGIRRGEEEERNRAAGRLDAAVGVGPDGIAGRT